MGTIKDEFQGFGEDFEGFPKRLPDDCVEYSLYVIDSKLKSHKDLLMRLEAVRKEYLKLADKLLKDYIWQRDGFKLELESGKGAMHLHGLTNYGDSVEDEWLIVYILKDLSKSFPELWVRVADTDGEFLLIEAANALPRWLNPEIAENRVWIHGDKLLIVPLSATTSASTTKTAPISRPLTLDEALTTISLTPEILINSPLIEAEAFYRLRNYPSQIAASLHHALVTIPRKLAYILHNRPAAIAPAVEAFYLRDPIALKPLHSAFSQLIFTPTDLVTISARFTKVLYAQLRSQQFSTPLVWREILPQSIDEDEVDKFVVKKDIWLQIGMKITSGFEMLISDPKNCDNRSVREIKIVIDDLATGNDRLPTDLEIMSWKDVGLEDNESWLDIDFKDFEKELQGKSQDQEPSGVFSSVPLSGFGDTTTQADLKKMVERFEAFLNDEDAGVDGAEMDDMDFDNDEEEYSEDDDSEDEDKDVSFDENEFTRMMREMMGMPSEEYDVSVNGPSGRANSNAAQSGRTEESDGDEDSEKDEAIELRKLMQRMEVELNVKGALNLDPTPKSFTALRGKSAAVELDASPREIWENESDDGDAGIDFNLAKNLLESFKSQAGMPGPGGNLMGMMGMQLPRDEGNTELGGKNAQV